MPQGSVFTVDHRRIEVKSWLWSSKICLKTPGTDNSLKEKTLASKSLGIWGSKIFCLEETQGVKDIRLIRVWDTFIFFFPAA